MKFSFFILRLTFPFNHALLILLHNPLAVPISVVAIIQGKRCEGVSQFRLPKVIIGGLLCLIQPVVHAVHGVELEVEVSVCVLKRHLVVTPTVIVRQSLGSDLDCDLFHHFSALPFGIAADNRYAVKSHFSGHCSCSFLRPSARHPQPCPSVY